MTRSFKNLLAGSFCALLYVGMAQAQTIVGTIYNVAGTSDGICSGGDCTDATNATPTQAGLIPSTDAVATFDVNGNDIDLQSAAAANGYTVAGFLATESIDTGGADSVTNITPENGATLASLGTETMDDTFIVFTGSVTVTTGEAFTAGHDDGLTLVIGSQTVISAPGPTSFSPTTGHYTGAPGTFTFTLDYAECCGAPADLEVAGLNLTSTTPEPAAAILIPIMLLGVALVSRKRSSRSV